MTNSPSADKQSIEIGEEQRLIALLETLAAGYQAETIRSAHDFITVIEEITTIKRSWICRACDLRRLQRMKRGIRHGIQLAPRRVVMQVGVSDIHLLFGTLVDDQPHEWCVQERCSVVRCIHPTETTMDFIERSLGFAPSNGVRSGL